MLEVGRVASETEAILRDENLIHLGPIRNVVTYIVSRQNQDGGYTFCQGIDSNAQDTYLALAILDLLRIPFPNLEDTIRWLQDFVLDSHYSHYYVASALRLCGEKPQRNLEDFLVSQPILGSTLGNVDVYVEVASEFQFTYMITELISMVEVEIDRKKIVSSLLSFKNSDGGFGARHYSNLNSTFHAVASLFNLGYTVESLNDTIEYVRRCEKPYGGFAVVPDSLASYMEHVFYGVSTLDLMREHPKHNTEIAQFVLKCQNSNGGFARSNVGLSTFEDTFYAIRVLKMIDQL